MSARFSEAEAALIDAARGTEERGVWLRRVALDAAKRQSPPRRTRRPRKDTAPPVVLRPPEGVPDIMAAIRNRKNGDNR